MRTILQEEKYGLRIRLVERNCRFFIVSEHERIAVVGLAHLGDGLGAATRIFFERCRAAQGQYEREYVA